VPSDTGADELTLYPVNCAKTDWLSGQAWGAYYEVEESGCPGPDTITATSTLNGTQQLTKGEDCIYLWINPSGEYYGRLEIYWNAGTGEWLYEQSFSYAKFDTASGPTTPDDPTGTYTSYQGTFTVTTP
jgi:hypothetical protein